MLTFKRGGIYALDTPSSCSSINHIPQRNNTVRRNADFIHPSTAGTVVRSVNSPSPSTKTNSNPKTRHSSGSRMTHRLSSRGNVNGALDPGAIGRKGAIPVPGSRNLVNFSILHNSHPKLLAIQEERQLADRRSEMARTVATKISWPRTTTTGREAPEDWASTETPAVR